MKQIQFKKAFAGNTRPGLKKTARLAAVFFSLLFSLLILSGSVREVLKPYHSLQMEAARKTEAAFSAIRNERLRRKETFPAADDPNQTGLIGASYSEITTTLGNLESLSLIHI